MGHPWSDGKFRIYIIKHLYKDKGKCWANSGQCTQWIPKYLPLGVISDRNKKIFRPFSASGKCWQKTGIHGSFIKRDAIRILDKISEWHPEHRFKVCKLLLNQVTEDVVEMKHAIVP